MAVAFGIGIEEEHQILDPHSGELRSEIERLLPLAQATLGDYAQPELYQAQVEVATEPAAPATGRSCGGAGRRRACRRCWPGARSTRRWCGR